MAWGAVSECSGAQEQISASAQAKRSFMNANRSIAKAASSRAKYNKAVPRLLAVLLLTAINFPLIAPAVFANNASVLPACCRRAGKHQCALKRAAQAKSPAVSVASVQGKCPFTAVCGASGLNWHAIPINSRLAAFENELIALGQATRVSSGTAALFPRAHYKRGPPQLFA